MIKIKKQLYRVVEEQVAVLAVRGLLNMRGVLREGGGRGGRWGGRVGGRKILRETAKGLNPKP